ncbi:CcdB family protein [Aquincola tertiaricarbonis]|uniref:Toxin CcdB n=1 Tax=Aquincola tertiaricarbonis TaxID=391953 RepID=A0ABY4SBS1_AQUTE|nr:CcdB family protein [Aquincola tertiaricarbonis]URI10793.1 CcdB family protein [Aquincola tertiaricarbonis]
MARFHVYANSEGGGLLLDVQANLLSHLNTCVVVPLLPLAQAPKPAMVLNPVFKIDGVDCMMATQFLAAVPRRVLGPEKARLVDQADVVVSALDCLFQGI